MNKLRQELKSILGETVTLRPAALRRSLRKDYLYATDLPQIADESAIADFRTRAESAGWRTSEENGWIQLDKTGSVQAEDAFPGIAGTEAKCCASLLNRHPNGRRPGERERRILIKAGEEGTEAYEKACAVMHREWAAALRHREALPDLTKDWFGGKKT